MATLYPVQGEPREVLPANGKTFTLRELKAFVGGYIEIVYARNGELLIVNELGKLEGLPKNEAATRLIAGPAWHGRTIPGDWIVGNALHTRHGEVD